MTQPDFSFLTASEFFKNFSFHRVFTHCYSTTVLKVLQEAFRDHPDFTVSNTEIRPRMLGRRMAESLSFLNIPVFHGADHAARLLLKDCDVFLFGAESITSTGDVVNKIGTRILAEYALSQNIPVYCCVASKKIRAVQELPVHDVALDIRDPNEVWEDPPFGVTVFNPGYEIIPRNLFQMVVV